MGDELDELVQECLVSSTLHHVNVLAATGACAPQYPRVRRDRYRYRSVGFIPRKRLPPPPVYLFSSLRTTMGPRDSPTSFPVYVLQLTPTRGDGPHPPVRGGIGERCRSQFTGRH